eukprot:1790538-Pleurochrysis_carterae.AAC.1
MQSATCQIEKLALGWRRRLAVGHDLKACASTSVVVGRRNVVTSALLCAVQRASSNLSGRTA